MTRSVPEIPPLLCRELEDLPLAAAVVDGEGTIVCPNALLPAMLGRSEDELFRANLREIVPVSHIERVARLLSAGDDVSDAEFSLMVARARAVPVLASARQTTDGLFLVTFSDLTRRVAAEQRLKEQLTAVTSVSDLAMDRAIELNAHNEELERRVRERTEQLRAAHMEAVYMLAIASEAKDEDTGGHVRRLERYARAVARQLGIGAAESVDLGYAAVLHDVGKIHVPDAILKKPGLLSPDERLQMQRHTLAGQHILSPSPFFAVAASVARSHHENWDGSGYPDGLAGEAIPLEARIVHVADVFDALTHARVYKRAWPAEQAVAAVLEGSGTRFDPAVVAAFHRAIAAARNAEF